MSVPSALVVDHAQLELLADRLAELLAPKLARRPLVDAGTLAKLIGTKREWVYEHAAELGARRLGDGPKARLRFDVDEAIAALPCLTGRESESAAGPLIEPAAPRRRRRGAGTGAGRVPDRALTARGRRVV